MVKTPCFHCPGAGSVPGWGTKIPTCLVGVAKKKFFIVLKSPPIWFVTEV